MKTNKIKKRTISIIISGLLISFYSLSSIAQVQWPQPNPDNVALFKPAKQNTTFEGGHANRAVDGNKDGHWHRGSVSHTHRSDNPWWQVNLLEEYDISSITIYNRTDCCYDRLNNFKIRVSKVPFEGNYGGEVFSLDGSTFENSKTFTNNIKGQYVRIYMEGSNILALSEVVVNGTPVNPSRDIKKNENIALGKRARQSSIYNYASANRANDGDTKGNFNEGSVMHTLGDAISFWEVDLGENFLVKEIVVHNRSDGGQDRLDNFGIYVTKRPYDQINGRMRIFPFTEKEKKFSPEKFKRFQGQQVGRYVRIQIENNQSLHLAEVQIYGDEIGDIELGQANDNVMYKASIFRNVTPLDSNIRTTQTTSLSKGMNFNRTVSSQQKSYWSLEATARTTVNYGIVSVGLEIKAGGGGEQINTTRNAQGQSVTESRSENSEVTQVVPAGYTRIEFHKFVINQSPVTYKFNGETYSWFRVNNNAVPADDNTTMFFPNNEAPNFDSNDNWVMPDQYQKILQDNPNYIQN